MPTPVKAARQCLTDEAARALDDAVAVARRRNHPQTTSLHAVSALLSLPSSALRDACRRAYRSPLSHPPRLQFRALELSVGVSLDRLPTAAKSAGAGDGPQISNSLMAAIKRSQANQRRNPASFHFMILYQQQQNQNQNQTASFLKVELKHFMLSILDDPIVSRVFGDAGFRSYDIKLALLQNPPVQNSRNRFFHSKMNRPVFLCNLESAGSIGPGLGLPDPNCGRIAEILGREEKRNPVLMGIYAKGAVRSFVESVEKGKMGNWPGLSVVCVENEIQEFVMGAMSEEKIGLRFEEVEKCLGGGGGGVVVSFGEVEVLVRDGNSVGAVGFVVERLGRLLVVEEEGGGGGRRRRKEVWLIGVAGCSEAYSKFVGMFPTVDRDWDLHLLTVTCPSPSATPSSLMGSFVPFGGFFPTTSEFRTTISSSTNPPSTRCVDPCNERYEQEVGDTLKAKTTTNEDNTSSNAKIFGLQRKWSDICQRVHCDNRSPTTRSQASSPLEGFRFGSGFEKPSSNGNPSVPKQLQSTCSVSINTETEQVPKVSEIRRSETPNTWFSRRSSSFLTPVTTDLGLGTIYNNTSIIAHEPDTPNARDHRRHHLSSPSSVPNFEGRFGSVDFKSLNKLLTGRVGWQDEAVHTINRTISLCRSGVAGRRGVWFAFIGPDRLGKRKIASALAECLLGNRESLIYVDLSSRERLYPLNSVFELQSPYCRDALRRKTVVDYIAGELSKKPCSVVFLENAEEADFLVQNSLFQAVRTGRFPYSLGREISINDAIFIVASAATHGRGSLNLKKKEAKVFPEERILEGERRQMRLSIGHASDEDDAKRIGGGGVNVKVVAPRKVPSKRKLVQSTEATCKTQKLDLNVPFQEEAEDCNKDCGSESEAWLHDFCDQVDGEAVFKPFDFDCLAEQVTRSIEIQFWRVFRSDNFVLEIEYEVMAQILAAAWSSDKKNVVHDWVEHVLGRCFDEAQAQLQAQAQAQQFAQYVMKLVNCESKLLEEQSHDGVCLPASINLN